MASQIEALLSSPVDCVYENRVDSKPYTFWLRTVLTVDLKLTYTPGTDYFHLQPNSACCNAPHHSTVESYTTVYRCGKCDEQTRAITMGTFHYVSFDRTVAEALTHLNLNVLEFSLAQDALVSRLDELVKRIRAGHLVSSSKITDSSTVAVDSAMHVIAACARTPLSGTMADFVSINTVF